MMNAIRNFVNDERGEDLIEYGLLAAFVAVIGVAVATLLGPAITSAFNRAVSALG